MKYTLPILIIIALLAVAVEPIVVKMSYSIHLAPTQLLIFRFLAAAIAVLPFCGRFEIVRGKRLFQLLEVSLLFLLTNIFVYLSLLHLSGIAVITIVTTTPAFVALVNQKLSKETLTKTFWLGFLLCFIGVLFTLDVFSHDPISFTPLGLLFIALVIIGSTTYRIKMDFLTTTCRPVLIANYIFLSNGLLALIFVPLINFSEFNLSYLRFGAWLGITAVVGNIAFLAALKVIGSTRISILGILQRPLLIILSAIILDEKIGFGQINGIIMVIIGIYFAKVKRREVKEPAKLELVKDL